MFTLSQKTKNSQALTNLYLASLPPSLMCFKCCVVTERTGGKWFCVMASESSSPQNRSKKKKKLTTVALSDEGIDAIC